MTDIQLALLMHRKKKDEKNKFELAEDQLLEDFVDASLLNGDPTKDPFTPLAIKRAKHKEELKAATHSLNNRDLHLELAFEILSKEGAAYVEEEKHQEMMDQLSQISVYVEQVDFSKPLQEKLHILLHISDSTMETILKIALAKYKEIEYETSLSIFSLLTCLSCQNELYWYQLGIVASSQLDQLDLALEVFAYAIYLNPDLLGARIFSAECYLKQGKMDDAKAELAEAKQIVKRTSPEQIWLDLLSRLEEEVK